MLLCVLLLTAVIVLCVQVFTNIDLFQTKCQNIMEERDQLLTKITNLSQERDWLLNKNTDLANERDELISKNNNTTKQRDQCNQEKNEILKSLHEFDGWIYFKFSLYYNSSERMNWTESRRYCTERGADLIIINNRQEQDLFCNGGVVWVGLGDSDEEGTRKWVDGSTWTPRLWDPQEPNSCIGIDDDCAQTDLPGLSNYPCDNAFRWICEKSILTPILP
ncbi:C-type lectin domain family 17, member A-like [Labeo rohita]|uniref:C-type lectin domain family 17, member A-like n=1 Tax=Labeo rohita TaxID=84645 RepID=UPI0021E337D2|nr:C-type lectin domain family 17, member A-like [Labeo rohita]